MSTVYLANWNGSGEWQIETSGKEEVWHRILGIHRDQLFCIGVISGVLQPVVVHDALRNVPQEGYYNWYPGAFFGIYQPDTFWFSAARRNNN